MLKRNPVKSLVLLLSLFLTTPVFASSLVDEILELSEFQQAFEKQYSGLINTIHKDEKRASSKQAEIRNLRTTLIKEQEDLYNQTISWPAVRLELETIYLETYSQQELLAFVEFLRNPAGRSFMKKEVQFISTFQKMMEKNATEFVERKEALYSSYREQVEKIETN